MKYLPVILLSAIAVAAAYFLYYKPKQEQAAADSAAALAAANAELTTVSTVPVLYKGKTIATSIGTLTTASTSLKAALR